MAISYELPELPWRLRLPVLPCSQWVHTYLVPENPLSYSIWHHHCWLYLYSPLDGWIAYDHCPWPSHMQALTRIILGPQLALTLADSDLWSKAETWPKDIFRYYSYLLCSVDGILCIHHDAMPFLGPNLDVPWLKTPTPTWALRLADPPCSQCVGLDLRPSTYSDQTVVFGSCTWPTIDSELLIAFGNWWPLSLWLLSWIGYIWLFDPADLFLFSICVWPHITDHFPVFIPWIWLVRVLWWHQRSYSFWHVWPTW